MKEERDMMPVAMTHESSLELSQLGDLYVQHAPEGIRLAFLLTGDRSIERRAAHQRVRRHATLSAKCGTCQAVSHVLHSTHQ